MPEIRIHSTLECDVLLIGAGGAGLRCAAEIIQRRPGTRVIATTKVGHCQKSHTTAAQGGLAAVDPRDTVDKPAYHMFDTWKGGDCMSDQNVVKKIVEAAWDEIVWLENHGMHFSRNEEGRLAKRTFGGHTLRFGEGLAYRAVFEADRTGKGIMDTEWGIAVKGGSTFFSQTIATELLFRDGRCVGAVLFNAKTGEFTSVSARATVFASGGSGQVFRVTTNCRQNTGDALAIALDSGLPVMDPEAVQFHPTGIVGPGILVSEAMRSEGGILRNRDLEPFMVRYAPKMKDLAPRDVVARAIETEIREGRGILNPDHNLQHVWIDMRHLSDFVHDVKLREITGFFKKFVNLDAKKDLCPVCPSNHYHMGGVPTTEFGEVQRNPGEIVPGLYAVGECACASFHGFNRLATNSVLELITMGRFVGERVVEHLANAVHEKAEDPGERTRARFSAYLSATGKDNLAAIRATMQNMMTGKVGVFRNEQGLTEACAELRELKARAEATKIEQKSLAMNQEIVTRWELDSALATSAVIARCALERRESRGGHFRDDYPERSNEFNRHTLAWMETFGEVRLGTRPVDMSIHAEGGPFVEKFAVIERKY